MIARKIWVAVRCCCQPTKVLGFFQIREEDLRIGRMIMRRKMKRPSFAALSDKPEPEPVKNQYEEGRIEALNSYNEKEYAIYSEDRPIEFWRELIGFVEARNEPAL